jgi:hypothetical protein
MSLSYNQSRLNKLSNSSGCDDERLEMRIPGLKVLQKQRLSLTL